MFMQHADEGGFRGYRLTAERGDLADALLRARDVLWESRLVWLMGPEVVDNEETILFFLSQVAPPEEATAIIIAALRVNGVFVT